MKTREKTKIVATIGPASASGDVLAEMVHAGMDVARFNFSHDRKDRQEERLRALKRSGGESVAVLQDLEGFRVRIGESFAGEGEMYLEKGARVRLVKGLSSDKADDIPFDHDGDMSVISRGIKVHIDGGKIVLEVESGDRESLLCRVEEGGTLLPRKGVNIPGVDLGFSGVTVKDREDLEFAFIHKIEFVAQSFVREAADVTEIKQLLAQHSPVTRVIAKIENRQAIDNIDSIIAEADGVMVARGDMGVSIPLWEVPFMQKMIIAKCHKAGKPVITATEMLESMTRRKIPTRAEVSDVANAILDGSDMVMLSEETAVGIDPAGAVRMMQRIIDHTSERLGQEPF